MNFYILSKPHYNTDREEMIANPFELTTEALLPSIDCDYCGIWASSSRIRESFSDTQLRNFKKIKFLKVCEWKSAKSEWAKTLGLSKETLQPGSNIGIPNVKILLNKIHNFMISFPGSIVVTKRVVESLISNNITGIKFIKLKKVNKLQVDLWELYVYGKGWRKEVDEKSIVVCSVCGREKFPDVEMIIDKSRWDGTDFFNIDNNPNMVIVTEKVVKLFKNENIKNVLFEKIDGVTH
jgi:hypothetical protein